MRTLIRTSQLHPEISGLIKTYSDPNYPNYSDIYGISGIKTLTSGNYLLVASENAGSVVRNINNVTGSVRITGVSGVRAYAQGQDIYIGLTGSTAVNTLNTLNGNISLVPKGFIDIWPLNSTQIAISGVQITGEGNILSYYSGGVLRLRSTSIGSLNNKSGALNILGVGGINVINTGQNIFIDGNFAALSGLHSINGIGGRDATLQAGNDIEIINQQGAGNMIVNYVGNGWGAGNFFYSSGSDVRYIGNFNFYEDNTGILINGNNNTIESNTNISTLNSDRNRIRNSTNSSFVNVDDSLFFMLTGSTIVNGSFGSGIFRHPYAFGLGTSSSNTYSANMHMKAVLSGTELLKTLCVPKTEYSGIFVPTGTVMIGHIDYVGTRFDITDFDASFNIADQGIYGRKYFVAQRGTNLSVQIRDQSDLFGGNDKYTLMISGGPNETFFLWGSGYSGQNAEDGLDKVHDVLFMANLQLTSFNLFV